MKILPIPLNGEVKVLDLHHQHHVYYIEEYPYRLHCRCEPVVDKSEFGDIAWPSKLIEGDHSNIKQDVDCYDEDKKPPDHALGSVRIFRGGQSPLIGHLTDCERVDVDPCDQQEVQGLKQGTTTGVQGDVFTEAIVSIGDIPSDHRTGIQQLLGN